MMEEWIFRFYALLPAGLPAEGLRSNRSSGKRSAAVVELPLCMSFPLAFQALRFGFTKLANRALFARCIA